jgi:hypothetical protein
MEGPRESVILVDLDSLFDTRLATIGLHDNKHLKTILDKKDHHVRNYESYGTLKYDEFKKLYDKRDKKTLSVSLHTMMHVFLDYTITEIKKTVVDNPVHSIPKLRINTFPYKLVKEEIDNIVESATLTYTCEVDVIYLEPEHITPKLLASEYDVFITYSYYEWLEVHSKTELFKKERCPEVAMFVPQISFSDPSVNVPNDFYEEMENMASPVISLKYLPIVYFSLLMET